MGHCTGGVLGVLLLSVTLWGAGSIKWPPLSGGPQCGSGPVAINVQSPRGCGCRNVRTRIEGTDVYVVAPGPCPVEACGNVRQELWTDYPECGGVLMGGG